MYTFETAEMMRIMLPASEYGKNHTIYIVPIDGLYGIWMTREDSGKALYLYCMDMLPAEEVVKDVLANARMYVDFYGPEFDDDGSIWP